MSSKPDGVPNEAVGDSCSPLHGGVLELRGRDAGAFAQAQLMNDVRALADGTWHWTGWLNSKGRVLMLGALLRLAEDHYWLLLPDSAPPALAEELRRFVFRAKLTLAARTDLGSRGVWCAPGALGSSAHFNRFDVHDAVVRLDWSGERPRTLLVGAQAELERSVSPRRGELATARGWAVEDLAHGLPRLMQPAVATHTPQMLGLTRLDAYSVKKGCYPGQEIVARTHFLGQAKRGLRRLQGDDTLRRGDSLLVGGTATGEVLCAASEGDRHEALAVLPLDLDAPMRSDTTAAALVTVIDFKQGLAR